MHSDLFPFQDKIRDISIRSVFQRDKTKRRSARDTPWWGILPVRMTGLVHKNFFLVFFKQSINTKKNKEKKNPLNLRKTFCQRVFMKTFDLFSSNWYKPTDRIFIAEILTRIAWSMESKIQVALVILIMTFVLWQVVVWNMYIAFRYLH